MRLSRSHLVIFIAIVLLGQSGCIPFGTTVESPAIEGVVLSAADGRPVGEAVVTIERFDTGAVTDEHGRFVIEPETKRHLILFVFPGASVDYFELEASHPNASLGNAHQHVSVGRSSRGLADVDLLVLLVPDETPRHDAFTECPELDGTADYTARLFTVLENHTLVDGFREAYTSERRRHFEEGIHWSLYEDFDACDIDEARLEGLLDVLHPAGDW